MKQYKAVSGPQNISVKAGQTQAAFDLFSELINRETTNGWEYHSMETITVTENPGCFQQPISTSHYMMIFSRDI